tara:strand:+ start:1413 stop:1619 length:207 start_codon:yes stop_codon:yes gene_type:complete
MKQRLTQDMGLKLVSLGLAVVLWWVIKLSANLRYSYDASPRVPAAKEKPPNTANTLTNAPIQFPLPKK